MKIFHILRDDGAYVCDSVGAPPESGWWTSDPVPQDAPIHTPYYVGYRKHELTGECYGGEWIDAGAPTPEEVDADLVAGLLTELNGECDRRLAKLKEAYPESEVLSWDKQEAEAKAGGGPLVAALAAARGVEEGELISRILRKAEVFAVLSGTIIGQRQALEDQVKAGAREISWSPQ